MEQMVKLLRVAILLSKFYHFEGSCAPAVPFTLKGYCAPNRAKVKLATHALQNPVKGTLSKIIEHRV